METQGRTQGQRPLDFASLFSRVERRVDARRIPVRRRAIDAPNTGDFDGARIDVDNQQDPECALFVLIHLFGHTVQWNLSPTLRALGQDSTVLKSDHALRAIERYERDATRYGIQLLHEAGLGHLGVWASRWWRADWKFLEHYYRTGNRLDIWGLLENRVHERLQPLPIPAFTPTAWGSRWSF